jgi:hypothetical protein
MFLVVSGRLRIQLPDNEEVVLGPGQFSVVPRRVQHNPIAEEEVEIVLIETVTTALTGDVPRGVGADRPFRSCRLDRWSIGFVSASWSSLGRPSSVPRWCRRCHALGCSALQAFYRCGGSDRRDGRCVLRGHRVCRTGPSAQTSRPAARPGPHVLSVSLGDGAADSCGVRAAPATISTCLATNASHMTETLTVPTSQWRRRSPTAKPSSKSSWSVREEETSCSTSTQPVDFSASRSSGRSRCSPPRLSTRLREHGPWIQQRVSERAIAVPPVGETGPVLGPSSGQVRAVTENLQPSRGSGGSGC